MSALSTSLLLIERSLEFRWDADPYRARKADSHEGETDDSAELYLNKRSSFNVLSDFLENTPTRRFVDNNKLHGRIQFYFQTMNTRTNFLIFTGSWARLIVTEKIIVELFRLRQRTKRWKCERNFVDSAD